MRIEAGVLTWFIFLVLSGFCAIFFGFVGFVSVFMLLALEEHGLAVCLFGGGNF